MLSLATQDSDNPDLRDRGFIYWRLLSTDPAAAKEVVLAEKPLISEETDLLEPTLLDELVCHISSLASVYHKPPSAFVEGEHRSVWCPDEMSVVVVVVVVVVVPPPHLMASRSPVGQRCGGRVKPRAGQSRRRSPTAVLGLD